MEELSKFVDVFDDHIVLGGVFSLLKTSYFLDKLDSLSAFDGFFPRTFLPGVKITSQDNPQNQATLTLFIIDSQKEIKTGVGLDWAPLVLGKSQAQLQILVSDYL